MFKGSFLVRKHLGLKFHKPSGVFWNFDLLKRIGLCEIASKMLRSRFSDDILGLELGLSIFGRIFSFKFPSKKTRC